MDLGRPTRHLQNAMTTDQRLWTAAELKHALAITFGTTRLGTPRLTEPARMIGITPRSLQRWLTGQRHPSPEHTLALRQALLPDPEVLTRQAREHERALEATQLKPRTWPRQWKTQNWHRPHTLSILTNPQLRISRPAVHLTDPAKKYYPPPGWHITSTTNHPNRPTAILAKHQLLQDNAATRIAAGKHLLDKGRSECWITPTEAD